MTALMNSLNKLSISESSYSSLNQKEEKLKKTKIKHNSSFRKNNM